MIKTKFGIIVLVCIMSAGCGWSGSQKDVADQYDNILNLITAEDWTAFFDCFSVNTCTFLDDFAAGLTSTGLYGYSSGLDLLSESAETTGLHNLSPDVSVILENDRMMNLTASGSSGSKTFVFKKEDDIWKLDLEQQFRATYETALEGTGISVDDIIAAGTDDEKTAPDDTGAE